jgi:hypothetical protein
MPIFRRLNDGAPPLNLFEERMLVMWQNLTVMLPFDSTPFLSSAML